MQTVGSFRIPADHPCLPGHFPSHAIVPGVVLLDESFALILAARPRQTVLGLPGVKFIHPVLPEQIVTVTARETDEQTDQHTIAFTCAVGSRVVLRGSLLLGSAVNGLR
jgi:3-hydroxyacyl-[acyl-carrier-protein] dehydratase